MINKVFDLLQKEMPEPAAFGWFHCMWIGFMIIAIIGLYLQRKKHSEKQLKWVLGVYGITALVLETLKQLSWSYNMDDMTKSIVWDYQWYAFPFQLCTTPIFVCIISLFLKKGKVRDSLFSYMAFFTILGSISTILIPDSCLINDILVNIHTMWLHLGSFVVSVYLLMTGEISIDFTALKRAFSVFVMFVCIANGLNLFVYNAGVLNGETFNMFYISPYFNSSLPVFDMIQPKVPYLFYLLVYIVALLLGASLIWCVAKLIQRATAKKV